MLTSHSSSPRHSNYRTVVAAWLFGALVSAGVLHSQQRGEREPARCAGKLRGMAGGVLHVETEKGERMAVAIDPRAREVSFQGVAGPAFLRPGMLVQFRAPLDKKGEAQEEISEMKVVSQRMGIQVGVQADGGFTGGDLFAGNDEDAGKKKRKSRNDTTPYVVTGTLRSIKDGKFYVAAGATVKGELSDNCQVSIDITDISLAREGDSVEVDGWRYPNQSAQIYASRLMIVSDKPLGVEEKKRRTLVKSEDKDGEKGGEAKAKEEGDEGKGKKDSIKKDE